MRKAAGICATCTGCSAEIEERPMNEKSKKRYAAGFLGLAALLLLLLLVNTGVGSVALSPSDILRLLTRDPGGDPALETAYDILWKIRIPRLLAAAILGGALSVSGFLLQTFFANPIAGPFVLGISSGAKLTVAMTLIFFLGRGVRVSSAGMVLAAFAGSMMAMALILAISGRVRNMSVLIICGVMIGYICSAVTDFAVTFADDSNIVNLHNWSLGSFSAIRWTDVRAMALIVLPVMVLTFLLSKPIGAYQMGEMYAANMGVNIKVFRVQLVLLSGILSACVTAFAGPIAFVGVAVPHLVRGLFRTARPAVIIPASFLGGAVFCLFCDLVARTAFAPAEISISSVTAVFGAPVVIAIMLRRREKTREHG